jgi:hypothetical protein
MLPVPECVFEESPSESGQCGFGASSGWRSLVGSQRFARSRALRAAHRPTSESGP